MKIQPITSMHFFSSDYQMKGQRRGYLLC